MCCKKLIYLASFVLVLGLVLTRAADAADPSLVGWWKFDETSGTIAQDSSGFGNNGTLIGDPQWVEGRLGGALEFDGVGDEVSVPYNAMANPEEPFTVSVWANVASGSTAYRTPISSRALAPSSGYGYIIYDNRSGH